ncbi:PAS domain-containing protein, partial [Acinetobacter baumannii]
MMELAADGIVLADAAGQFVEANAAALAMFGYKQDEFLGLSVEDVLGPGEKPCSSRDPAFFGEDGSTVSELHFRRRDGSSFLGE